MRLEKFWKKTDLDPRATRSQRITEIVNKSGNRSDLYLQRTMWLSMGKRLVMENLEVRSEVHTGACTRENEEGQSFSPLGRQSGSQGKNKLLLPGTLLSTGATVLVKEAEKTNIKLICIQINTNFIL